MRRRSLDLALGRALSPASRTPRHPVLREGAKAQRRKGTYSASRKGQGSRSGRNGRGEADRPRASDCCGRTFPAPRTRRRKRSARPATGTRGWTTSAAFVATRKRPDFYGRTVGSLTSQPEKDRGFRALPLRLGRDRRRAARRVPRGTCAQPVLPIDASSQAFPDVTSRRPSASRVAPLGHSRRTAPWPAERSDRVNVPCVFLHVKPPRRRLESAFAAGAIMPCHGGADVAEPVDAGDLKSPAPRGVRVRVPPSAPEWKVQVAAPCRYQVSRGRLRC